MMKDKTNKTFNFSVENNVNAQGTGNVESPWPFDWKWVRDSSAQIPQGEMPNIIEERRMTVTYENDIPEKVRNIVSELIEIYREELLGGEGMPAQFLIGRVENPHAERYCIDTRTPDSRLASIEKAKLIALVKNADYVITTAEVWELPTNLESEAGAILKKYGSIAAYPARLDKALIQVETQDCWALFNAPILPSPTSKKVRRLGQFACRVGAYKECGPSGITKRILPRFSRH